MCPDRGRATFETSPCRATSANPGSSATLIRAVSSETVQNGGPDGSSAGSNKKRERFDMGLAPTIDTE